MVSLSVFGRELGLMIYRSGPKSEGMNVVGDLCRAGERCFSSLLKGMPTTMTQL